MKSTELRIGNFAYENDNLVVEICNWHYEAASLKNTPNEIDVKPIPLTEEWLVKFGIIKTKDQDVCRINYVYYHKGTDTYNYCLCYYFDDEGCVDNEFKVIKYVHQLQNLYFALTNKELKIKK